MLFWKKITKSLTVDDLPEEIPDTKTLRGHAKILIIDDKPFEYENALRSSGFDIKVQNQWNDVKDAETYNIVVSDNRDVANSINPNCDGLSMVIQAMKIYPYKKFAIYSASLLDIRNRYVPGLLVRTKGDNLDTWSDMLDDAILEIFDTRLLWRKIESTLNNKNISEKERRLLQHRYVQSVLEQKNRVENDKWSFDKNTANLIIRIASLAVNAARLYATLNVS